MNKNKLILLFLCTGCLAVYGQGDISALIVDSLKTFTVVQEDSINPKGATKFTYFNSGQLKKEEHYSNDEEKIKDGKYIEWYENGCIRSEIDYVANKTHGQLLTYWKNGTLKRMDFYKEGKFIDGQCFNEQGDTIPYFKYIKLPQFPGGEKSMIKFLADHIKYPQMPRKQGIEGQSVYKFAVSPEGKVVRIELIKSLHPLMDKEALRVIRLMPNWEPGLLDGEPVLTYYTLPVSFRLN